MTISAKAISFLVAQEDGDQVYYDRTEEHWDWPGGASGPTIGVGYDCGYTTREQCMADWKGIVSDSDLERILQGVGRTGTRAHLFVLDNRDQITVTYAQALTQFTTRELPKQEKLARLTLPHWDNLSPDSAGALLSVGYNRGWEGFTSTLPRYRELRAIRDLMIEGKWTFIPAQIAGMVRLWPSVPSLRRRRMLEAAMFSDGVPFCKPLSAVSADTPTTSPQSESSTEGKTS